MDWSRLLDESYNPYSGITDALLPLQHALSGAGVNHTAQVNGALVVMALGGLALSRLGGRRRTSQPVLRRERYVDNEIVRADNNPWLKRQMWNFAPPADLMKVDGLVLDRTGDRSHGLWIGPTGRGKSQSVATVRCDGERPWLAVMPDTSKPLRARADFIWTAGESVEPIDFLKGTPDDVAHFLTEVFRSGGEGVWKRAAFMATKQVVESLDKLGEPRSLLVIGQQLEALCETNNAMKRMCEGWVTRFLGAAEAMGDSVGPGGIDIADYLNAGLGVVIDNNAWKRPGLKGDVVAFGLAEAKRVAELVPGGFRLIFEEAKQLGDRIDLADPFFYAARLREVAVDALVHSEEKLPDAMTTNSATRVYFRPNQEHRKKVAAALDLSEGEVDRIPDYHAWIEHDGRIRRLVHFPAPKSIPAKPGLREVGVVNGNGDGNGNADDLNEELEAEWDEALEDAVEEAEPEPIDEPEEPEPPQEMALPFDQLPKWLGLDRDALRMWTNCKRTGMPAPLWNPERGLWVDPKGCYEWQGLLTIKKNAPPRPRSSKNGKDVTPYRELFNAKNGFYPDPTFDHWCGNPICCNPDHGEPCSIPDNNARDTFRHAAFIAAGWELKPFLIRDDKIEHKRWVKRLAA